LANRDREDGKSGRLTCSTRRSSSEGVKYNVFLHDELYSSLLATTGMQLVVKETRRRVLQER
jgi:hypothetical protein